MGRGGGLRRGGVPGSGCGEATATPGGAGCRTRPRPLPSPPPLAAGRTPAGTCGGHCDDEEHRPGDDARKATARVPPRQVGSVARDERRRRLRGLREVDDAPGYGQDAGQHKDLGLPLWQPHARPVSGAPGLNHLAGLDSDPPPRGRPPSAGPRRLRRWLRQDVAGAHAACPAGSRPMRRACSPSLNTLTPVMAGLAPGSRPSPAPLTATPPPPPPRFPPPPAPLSPPPRPPPPPDTH